MWCSLCRLGGILVLVLLHGWFALVFFWKSLKLNLFNIVSILFQESFGNIFACKS